MTTIIMDFGWASLLLLLAKLIRVKVPFIQKFFMPSALVAGIFGIIAGPYCLDLIPFSDSIGGYAGALTVVMAATLALGGKNKVSFRTAVDNVGDQLLTNSVAYLSQWGVGLLIGIVVLPIIWPGINEWFGFMMPTGWAGGYGTSAALGPVFEAAGFTGATSAAMTFATIGMVLGTVGGVALVNVAAHKGWTAVVKKPSELPEEFRSGLYRGKRESMGEQTVSNMSMDTMTFHFMLVLIIAFCAYKGGDAIKLVTGIGVPPMAVAMVMSSIANKCINAVGAGSYVDEDLSGHIGGLMTDYLVFFGVATIDLNVVAEMWQPIVFMSVIGVLTIFFYLWMCKRHCDNYWFEKAVIILGWASGSTPTSVLLVRTCDPEFKTRVFQNWCICWIFVSILDMFNTSLTPHFTVLGYGIEVSAVLLGASAVLYALMIVRTKARKKALK